jgi:hypothetical protein
MSTEGEPFGTPVQDSPYSIDPEVRQAPGLGPTRDFEYLVGLMLGVQRDVTSLTARMEGTEAVLSTLMTEGSRASSPIVSSLHPATPVPTRRGVQFANPTFTTMVGGMQGVDPPTPFGIMYTETARPTVASTMESATVPTLPLVPTAPVFASTVPTVPTSTAPSIPTPTRSPIGRESLFLGLASTDTNDVASYFDYVSSIVNANDNQNPTINSQMALLGVKPDPKLLPRIEFLSTSTLIRFMAKWVPYYKAYKHTPDCYLYSAIGDEIFKYLARQLNTHASTPESIYRIMLNMSSDQMLLMSERCLHHRNTFSDAALTCLLRAFCLPEYRRDFLDSLLRNTKQHELNGKVISNALDVNRSLSALQDLLKHFVDVYEFMKDAIENHVALNPRDDKLLDLIPPLLTKSNNTIIGAPKETLTNVVQVLYLVLPSGVQAALSELIQNTTSRTPFPTLRALTTALITKMSGVASMIAKVDSQSRELGLTSMASTLWQATKPRSDLAPSTRRDYIGSPGQRKPRTSFNIYSAPMETHVDMDTVNVDLRVYLESNEDEYERYIAGQFPDEYYDGVEWLMNDTNDEDESYNPTYEPYYGDQPLTSLPISPTLLTWRQTKIY